MVVGNCRGYVWASIHQDNGISCNLALHSSQTVTYERKAGVPTWHLSLYIFPLCISNWEFQYLEVGLILRSVVVRDGHKVLELHSGTGIFSGEKGGVTFRVGTLLQTESSGASTCFGKSSGQGGMLYFCHIVSASSLRHG